MKKITYILLPILGMLIFCNAGTASPLDDLAKEQSQIKKNNAAAAVAAADCKQAKDKRDARVKEIKIALGLDTNEKNLFMNIEGKVVDFAKDGIFISNTCADPYTAGLMFGQFGAVVAMNCTEERRFIYTSNTDYANNAKFDNKGLVYHKAGNYKYTTITGATNSVPAYKETKYKASEIDIKTYLKDKTFECD
jgi:hypothetical protein